MKNFFGWFSVPLLQARLLFSISSNEQLRTEVAELRKKTKRLASDLVDLQREKNALDDMCSGLSATLQEQRKSTDFFSVELAHVTAELENERRAHLAGRNSLVSQTERLAEAIVENTALKNAVHGLQIELTKESDKVDILTDRVELFEKVVSLNHKLVESAIQLTVPSNERTSASFVFPGQSAPSGESVG